MSNTASPPFSLVAMQGGHAAMPHLDVDPIVAAAQTISSLQSIVAREISPLGEPRHSCQALGPPPPCPPPPAEPCRQLQALVSSR